MNWIPDKKINDNVGATLSNFTKSIVQYNYTSFYQILNWCYTKEELKEKPPDYYIVAIWSAKK